MDIKQIVLTALFALVVSFLGLVPTRVYDYMWKPFFVNHNMKHLREAMGRLKARRADVKIQASKAELELKTFTNEVKGWLDKVKSIEDEVIHMEDEVIHMEEEILWWRLNYRVVYSYLVFWKRYNLGYKVVTKCREVTKLYYQGFFKDVATELPPPVAQELPCIPRLQAMIVNRDQILRYLSDEEAKMIGIWGMGGVGKTTLLRLINNFFVDNKLPSFERMIFVVASKDGNVEELQKEILKNLGLPPEGDDINSQTTLLFNFLKNKKVLLLLDDLWEAVDLIHLGIPLNQGECKVVFTTRSVFVCRLMKADKELKVECLKEEEAWSLFKEEVGQDIINADPNIGRLAKEVVKECGGLPLALITIGRTMSDKKTWREWQDVLNLLRNSRYDEISGMPNDMFRTLEFSYKNLQSDVMRECFLTCSMWPEGSEISKHNLIECWMGLNLIDDYKTIGEAYDRGYSIIESLIGACLLEHGGFKYASGDFSVKMQNVLRSFAFWMASDHGKNKDKWMVQAGVGLKECKVEKWVGPHRISLMHSNTDSLPEQLPDCPNLSVLMLYGSNLRNIPQGFFNCLRSLKYLDLSGCFIKELPAAVCGMVNLQFLNLEYTPIKNLPNELGNLVNLKYLLLGHTFSLKSIPWKSISGLPMLKLLDLFDCGGAQELQLQGGFEALARLDGRLMGLGISIDMGSSLYRLSLFSAISIMKLEIKYLEGIESLALPLPNHLGSKSTSGSLRVLRFHVCESLKRLNVNSQGLGGIPNLTRLERLELMGLVRLEKIVWMGVTPKEFLPSLHNLRIHNCYKLEDVSWVHQLPNLEFLQLIGCDELKTVIGVSEVADRVNEHILAFPRLRKLELWDLPNLHGICSPIIPFPNLENVSVIACPKLMRLPFQASNIPNKFQEIRGEARWWEDLEWEDRRTKPLLENHFKAEWH